MARRQRKPSKSRADEQARLLALGTDDHYLDAALYDFEYRDQNADIDWYRAVAAERADERPIVELGVGTGRIAIPLAAQGHRVLGIDRAPSMLERLRAKLADQDPALASRIEGRAGEATALPVPDESARLVIAPFNVLQHLYQWEQLLACFHEVHRVLEPGGTFAFDVLRPDLEWLGWNPDKRHSATRFVHPTTGERLVYTTNHTYDHETQVCHVRIYYDKAPAMGGRFRPPRTPVRLVHLAHRQIFPEELRALLAIAGFHLESLTGDFLDLGVNEDVESQVVVAVKIG
jgi:ubiquinone/menaquinone biosynthesis C-methylase UbiE